MKNLNVHKCPFNKCKSWKGDCLIEKNMEESERWNIEQVEEGLLKGNSFLKSKRK